MMSDRPEHPEPVPTSTQLAVLPFLAALEGYLAQASDGKDLRVTMHRVMAREKHRYIQQICTYLGSESNLDSVGKQRIRAGRLFPANTGLMGKAIHEKRVFRTKHFENDQALEEELKKDLETTGSGRTVDEVAKSYLSIPFLGSDLSPVLVLYADSQKLNFFADDDRVYAVLNMCEGFCRFFDWLATEEPFSTLRNFLTPDQEFKTTESTAYENVQELIDVDLPKFKFIRSFNYETTSSQA